MDLPHVYGIRHADEAEAAEAASPEHVEGNDAPLPEIPGSLPFTLLVIDRPLRKAGPPSRTNELPQQFAKDIVSLRCL
jgi:hypothetical protein